MSQNVIKRFRLEGTLDRQRSSNSNCPAVSRDTFYLHQASQSSTQPGQNFSGGWSMHFSRQSLPALPLSLKNFYLDNMQKLTSVIFQFKTLPPCPVTTCPCKKYVSSFLVGSLHILEGCSEGSLQFSFSRLYSPNSLSLSLQERASFPLIIFMALLWTHSNRSTFFLFGGPELKAVVQVVSFAGRVEGQNHLLRSAAEFLLMQPRMQLSFWIASAHCQVMLIFPFANAPSSSQSCS